MSEIKSHPWFLKNLPRELKEEAQAAYYSRRGDAGGASSNANGNATTFSLQSVEDIMRIVQEAQTLPRPARPVAGYGWGASEDDDDDEQYQGQEEEEEDDYDRTVRQVHASGDFDISKLQI